MFFDRFINAIRGLFGMYTQRTAAPACRETAISDYMANSITAWCRQFYGQDTHEGYPSAKTKAAVFITNFTATLATEELELNLGSGARAESVTGQLQRNILPQLHNAVQLAAAGGQAVLKPFVSGNRILTDVVPADRFYPTRINAAGQIEACFFTDFARYNGREVVRCEFHDLQPDGYYIHNEAYYDDAGSMRGAFDWRQVPQWADLEADCKITGIDRPLFAVLKMPFANTIDNTSRLPVSLYANSMDALEELDRIYGEFLHEVHSGKRKRIVAADAVNPKLQIPGMEGFRPIPFRDLTTDLYLVLDTDGTAHPFDDYSPELRIEPYQKAINVQIRMIERQCGFTEGTFCFDIKEGRMTATQVTSDDRDTYSLIKAIQDRGLRQGLEDLAYIYNVYADLNGLAPAGEITCTVSFGDSVFEDTQTEFARRMQMVSAGLLKPEALLAWYFGCDEAAAAKLMPTQSAPEPLSFRPVGDA